MRWVLPMLIIAMIVSSAIVARKFLDDYRLIMRSDHLGQILMAIENYHSEHEAYPPAYTLDQNGKPLCSWRVLILPYLGCEELFREYHRDEPWDSPNNRPLLARIPPVFQCPLTGAERHNDTGYLVILRGKGPAFFDPSITPSTFSRGEKWLGSPVPGAEILSSPVVVVEAPNSGIPWTQPCDVTYDAIVEGTFKKNGKQESGFDLHGRFCIAKGGDWFVVPDDISEKELTQVVIGEK
jgi:hypothetical protein